MPLKHESVAQLRRTDMTAVQGRGDKIPVILNLEATTQKLQSSGLRQEPPN